MPGDVDGHLVQFMDPTGMNRNTSDVAYPGISFCPLYKIGVIHNATCSYSDDHFKTSKSLTPLVLTTIFTQQFPNNKCWVFNSEGVIKSWTTLLHCDINSTNVDGNVTFPGRVRAYVDSPGLTMFTTQYNEMNYNSDSSIDGQFVIAYYTSYIFFQARVYAWGSGKAERVNVDYVAEENRIPYAHNGSYPHDMRVHAG
jgi:hypothetical protein